MTQSIIGYLKQELNGRGDFMAEYKRLSDGEKQELKAYAAAEMAVLGIVVK